MRENFSRHETSTIESSVLLANRIDKCHFIGANWRKWWAKLVGRQWRKVLGAMKRFSLLWEFEPIQDCLELTASRLVFSSYENQSSVPPFWSATEFFSLTPHPQRYQSRYQPQNEICKQTWRMRGAPTNVSTKLHRKTHKLQPKSDDTIQLTMPIEYPCTLYPTNPVDKNKNKKETTKTLLESHHKWQTPQ